MKKFLMGAAALLLALGATLAGCTNGDSDDDDDYVFTSGTPQVVTTIKVDAKDATTTYALNDTFSADGVVVTAVYQSGKSSPLVKEQVQNATFSMKRADDESAAATTLTSGVTKLAAAGTYTVTVSYKGQTATFDITVADFSLDESGLQDALTVGQPLADDWQSKVELKDADGNAVTDATITLTGADGAVASGTEIQAGAYTLTVTRNGYTVTRTLTTGISNTTSEKTDVNDLSYWALETSAAEELQNKDDAIDVNAHMAPSGSSNTAGDIDWKNPLVGNSAISGFTFMADVYYTTGEHYDALLYFYNPTYTADDVNFIGLYEDGNIRANSVKVKDDSFFESCGNVATTGFAARKGAWNNVAVTITSDGTITYYMNGEAGKNESAGKGENATWERIKAQLTEELTNIGVGVGNPWWKAGYVDEGNLLRDIRVYPTALTAAQVQKIYGATLPAIKSVVIENATKKFATGAKLELGNATITITDADGKEHAGNAAHVTLSAVKKGDDGATVQAGGTLATGSYTVTATYTAGDGDGFSGSMAAATYDIEVVEGVVLTGITVDAANSTTTFTKGAEFVPPKVTATYSNSSEKSVTVTAEDCSGYDMTKAGTQTVSVSYTDENDTPQTTTYSILVQEPLGYEVNGKIAKDTEVPPVAVTEETGVSVSFWLGSDYSNDFTDVIATAQSWIRLSTLGSVHDGTWIGSIFEAVADVGTDFSATYGNAKHTIFYSEAAYVTISFDGSTVKFYKNGKLALTYGANVTGWNNENVLTNTVSVADFSADVIEDIAKTGLKLNPGNVSMTNVIIDKAVTDTTAKTAFDDAVSAITVIALDTSKAKTEFIVGDEFSSDGLVITATDANGSFEIPLDFVTVSEVSTTTASESVEVTVTLKDKTTVTAKYTIKVVAADSVSIPTAVYYNQLKEAGSDLTIVGADNNKGSFESDSTFGTVFKNVSATTTRTNYLKLPENTLQHSATTKQMTIGFWVCNTTTDTNIYHPLFAAYHAAPQSFSSGDTYNAETNNTANTSPMFIIQSRGTAQVNCAGWCDFVSELNNAKKNTEDINWLGEQNSWHYYTCVITETSLTVYGDGNVINAWTIDNTTQGSETVPGQIIGGLFANTGDTALSYVCLGGNQAWAWADTDAPYSFAKFSVWDTALSATQINKIVSSTKNSSADTFAPSN